MLTANDKHLADLIGSQDLGGFLMFFFFLQLTSGAEGEILPSVSRQAHGQRFDLGRKENWTKPAAMRNPVKIPGNLGETTMDLEAELVDRRRAGPSSARGEPGGLGEPADPCEATPGAGRRPLPGYLRG